MRAPMARVAFAFALAGMAVTPAAAQAAQGRKAVPAAGPRVTRGAQDRGATPKAAAQSLRVYLAARTRSRRRWPPCPRPAARATGST
jgi:hypothetical protein